MRVLRSRQVKQYRWDVVVVTEVHLVNDLGAVRKEKVEVVIQEVNFDRFFGGIFRRLRPEYHLHREGDYYKYWGIAVDEIRLFYSEKSAKDENGITQKLKYVGNHPTIRIRRTVDS